MMLYAPWIEGVHERLDNPLYVLIEKAEAELIGKRYKKLAAIEAAYNADRISAEEAYRLAHEPPAFYVTDEALPPLVGNDVEYRPKPD